MAEVRFQTLSSISEVSANQWNGLLDPASSPFLDWRWLSALEGSGCASAESGWTPRHLTLWRGDRLIAAAPAYIKEDSDGDFARDWDLGSAAEQAGYRYYPKLVVGVPFTPVTGPRLLVAPRVAADEERSRLGRTLWAAALEIAERERLGTIQILFPTAEEAKEAEGAGFARRVSFQFHWFNEGYRDFDDFLSRFTSKRRAMLKRERAAADRQGIALRTLREAELRLDPLRWARAAHALHSSTVQKLMWGRGWLNRDFYERVFTTMPERLELVVAERQGKIVAGAFNVASSTRLYGRYWGCFEDHPFLHFNVCYYHSIAECIARGVEVFEGGAGGEHKLARGFAPSETFSAHLFLDGELDRALRDHLRRETPARLASLAHWRKEGHGRRTEEDREVRP